MAKKTKTQHKTAPQTKKKGASVQDLIGIKTFICSLFSSTV